MLRGTGAEMWRVRTMRTGRPRARSARAASHESVELCALSTSQRLRFSHSNSTLTPSGRFLAIGSAIAGTSQFFASAQMRASGGQMSLTSLPRRMRPCDSERMRISCPPQPSEDSVWTMESRSEEHTSELQSRLHLVCRLLLEKKKRILLTYS